MEGEEGCKEESEQRKNKVKKTKKRKRVRKMKEGKMETWFNPNPDVCTEGGRKLGGCE